MIRQLGPGDWAAFRDIRLEMLRTDPTAFGSTLAEWAAKPQAEVEDWLRSIRLFAAVEEGRCLSCAGWHPRGGPIAAHRAHVIAVYTRAEARGRGLSGGVFAALEADAAAQGIRQLELEVAEDGAAALRAYEKAGFTVTGRVPRGLCHDGVFRDEIAMVKAIA